MSKKRARKTTHKSRITAIMRGHKRALQKSGVTFTKQGLPKKRGKRLSEKQITRAVMALKRPHRHKHHQPPKPKPRQPPKPKPRQPRQLPRPEPAPRTLEPKVRPSTKKPVQKPGRVTAAQRAALGVLPAEARTAAIDVMARQKQEAEAKSAKTKRGKAQIKTKAKAEKTEVKKAKTAKQELAEAIKDADKKGDKSYGYNPITKKHHIVVGTLRGLQRIPFKDRANYIQATLKNKFAQWHRDVLIQSVHIREYLTQGDHGAGRQAIIEKVQNAGLRVIEKLEHPKKGKPIRIYQIYVSMIRVVVRSADAGHYGGYATHPIGTSDGKASTDIRGLQGFENVGANENPRIAFERLLERLDDHLDEVLDGLPVVYIKSLQIKFDVQSKDPLPT